MSYITSILKILLCKKNFLIKIESSDETVVNFKYTFIHDGHISYIMAKLPLNTYKRDLWHRNSVRKPKAVKNDDYLSFAKLFDEYVN